MESSGYARDEALRVLGEGWEQMDAVIESARRTGLLESHESGEEWSAADLVGHVASWERLALELIEDRRMGAALRIEVDLAGPDPVDRFNARTIEVNRSRPIADVLDEAARIRRDLAAAIAELADDEWSALVPSTTREPRPLGDVVGGLMGAPDRPFGHISAHRGDLTRLGGSAPST